MKKSLLTIVAIAVLGVGAFFLLNGMVVGDRSDVAGDVVVDDEKQSRATGIVGKILNLSFGDYSGNEINLHDFAGKPLVINSWAAWCPFCRKELRDFAEAQNEFSAEGETVIIIAIDRKETLATAKKYSDELGVTDDLILLLDPEDSFYKTIGGFSMPETVFINAAGEMIYHKRGPMSLDEIKQKVQDIL